MGMYDYIDFKAPCVKCGTEILNWQSKDGDCVLGTLQPLQVNHFYSYCPSCGEWHDYFRNQLKPDLAPFGKMEDFIVETYETKIKNVVE